MTTAATTTLTAWLGQQLDADEAAARAAKRGGTGQWGSWNRSWDTEQYRDLVDESAGERIARLPMDIDEHIARHDPARVLAQIAAMRAIVAEYERVRALPLDLPTDMQFVGARQALEGVVRALATIYADRPGFQEAWR